MQLCALRRLTACGQLARSTSPSSGGYEWDQSYTREEWLDALQTSGGVIPESQLAELLEGVGDAIDSAGGSFTMSYVTFVVTAVRCA